MNPKRYYWAQLILALILGLGLGLTYSWVISPVRYVAAEPNILRDDFKDYYRSAIAAAYASNTDLERARARLALLGDPDPSQALTAQAQRMLAAGASPEEVQYVALLASALQGQAAVSQSHPATETVSPETAIPTKKGETPVQPYSTATVVVPEASEPATEIGSTNTPIPQVSATPRPTQTATTTLGAPYQLIGQDTVCDPELAEGLLQVMVTKANRQQVPGAEIVIAWNNGEEHIFTGLKPELGYGYADFLMSPDITYSVRMADGGTPATGLSAPVCTGTDDSSYRGGFYITFQQP